MTRRALASSLILLFTLGAVTAARSELAQPRLIRVRLGPGLSASTLVGAGLDVVRVRGTSEAIVLEFPGDEARLARLGAVAEILDEHPGRTAALRSAAELAQRPRAAPHRVRSAIAPDGVFRTQMLPPFGSGSMGGFWTSDEIKMKLDELVANDANGAVADKLDTLGYSRKGRPIWGLRLGTQGTGPAVFFNALTHANEPESMQALFYFVDDLLSRYGTDPLATYLLDQRVIYFVPLVNPDGYKINEDYYFASGGTVFGDWRKNARDNNANGFIDAADGVDINRNYGYQWGYDNLGSSPDSTADTYRGPYAFSEPETRAQRDIVTALQPRTGLTFHTFSDGVIHPWGWTATQAPDLPSFKEWSDELTRDNAYLSGTIDRVLGYRVNGEFNDWCYGDTVPKPRLFSWTVEIGDDNDYFWPPPSRIVPLARENLRACYVVAAIAGPYVHENGVDIVEGALNAGHAAQILVRARNLGTGAAGPGLVGAIAALDPGVQVYVGQVSYPTLGSRQNGDPGSAFWVAADDTVTPGRLVRFRIDFSAPGNLFSRDTFAIALGTPTLVASDGASSGLAQWNPGSWDIVSNDPDHPSQYFADSKLGNYATNANNLMRLIAPLNLSAGVHAYALYEARWEFEPNYDAASVDASLTGASWSRLVATGTTPGSGIGGGVQTSGLPYYAGNRRLWKPERADLSAFTGPAATAVQFRFRLQSDDAPGTEYDGFNFDSLRIVVYDPAAQPPPAAVDEGPPPRAIELATPWPNPVRGFARFSFALPRAGPVRLEILDVQGRRVRALVDGALSAHRYVHGWDARDDGGRLVLPGMYLVRLSGATGEVARRFVVLN